MGNKTKWNFKTVPIPKHLEDSYEYPLYRPGHTTSTLLISMFLAFTIGFVACHEIYAGLDKRNFTLEIDK